MTTLGAVLSRVAPGEVTITLPVRDALAQQHGGVHAGALTSGRTLTVCTADAWAIDDAGRERHVATLQGTMMCLVGTRRVG